MISFKQYLAEAKAKNIAAPATVTPLNARKALEMMKTDAPIALKCIASILKNLLQKHPKDFVSALSNLIMTPTNLGLSKLVVDDKFPLKLGNVSGAECWFSGRCLMMSQKVLAAVMQQMEKQGLPVDDYLYGSLL